MNNNSRDYQKPSFLFVESPGTIVRFIQKSNFEFVYYLHRCRTLKTYKKTLDFKKNMCYNILIKRKRFPAFSTPRCDTFRRGSADGVAILRGFDSTSFFERGTTADSVMGHKPILSFFVLWSPMSVRQGWWIFIKRRGGSPPLRRNHRSSAVLPPQGTAGTRK